MLVMTVIMLLGQALPVVPCTDVPADPTFVGPPLPSCKPTSDLLEELELLRAFDLLDSWEIIGE